MHIHNNVLRDLQYSMKHFPHSGSMWKIQNKTLLWIWIMLCTICTMITYILVVVLKLQNCVECQYIIVEQPYCMHWYSCVGREGIVAYKRTSHPSSTPYNFAAGSSTIHKKNIRKQTNHHKPPQPTIDHTICDFNTMIQILQLSKQVMCVPLPTPHIPLQNNTRIKDW